MDGHDDNEITATRARRACLVEGCTCKDARIVSSRRASWFASVARARGETADRVVEADASWVLPTWSADPELTADLAADLAAHLDAAA